MSAKGKRGSNRNASARAAGGALHSPARKAAWRAAAATKRSGSWLAWTRVAAHFAATVSYGEGMIELRDRRIKL